MSREASTSSALLFSVITPLLLCASLLSAAGSLEDTSPEFLIEKWTAGEGLPSSSIFGLARAPDGFLWIGTDRGLARFDGAQFRVFNHANLPGLRSDYMQNMAAGPDSHVYIGTWGGGLSVLNHGRSRAFGKAEGIKSNVVNVVVPVSADEAWFGTDAGFLYHYHEGVTTEVGSDSLPHTPIYGLAKAPDGTLWIGTESGLFYFSQGIAWRYRPKLPLPGIGIYDLAITDSGALFAANDRGLFQIQGDRWRSWSAKEGLPSDRVQVILAAPRNVLLIGTDMGAAQLIQGRPRPIEMPFCNVSSLAVDTDKSFWIGCNDEKGLLRLRQPPVRMLSLSGAYRWMSSSSLAEDESGAVWIGTAHGLICWRNNRSFLYTSNNGLPNTGISTVSSSPSGGVWIGTWNGFARMRNGSIRSFRTRESSKEDPIFCIMEDHSGNLWVAASDGLYRQRPGRLQMERVPNIKDFTWTIREDHVGSVWVATRHLGLFHLIGDSQVRFTTTSGLPSNQVYSVVEDKTGDLWVGSEGGLTRIRNGKCATLGEGSGLPPGRVIAVESDSQGHLWLKTANLTVVLDLAEANRAVDQGGNLSVLRFLRDEDGFGHQLNRPVTNSILRHSSGEMWFATLAGVGRVDPEFLRTPVPTLRAEVDSISSDTGEHDFTQPVELRPGDQHLRLSCSSPALVGATTREFRYRLAGFDTQWRAGGQQRDVVYTSLPPGKYRFEASVRRPFEPWSDASAPIEIRVLPHFYQTWWWYALLVFASASTVFFAYRLRIAAFHNYYAALMTERLRERSRLARELHDTLAQGMAGIHIQIEAAQVLLDVDPRSIRRHLENVERIAREASINTRKSIAELRSEEDASLSLREVLQEAAANFSRSSSIPLAVDIAANLPSFSYGMGHEIARLTEEALANVRLHSRAQHAHLTAESSGKVFLLEVRDDGTGFENSAPSGAVREHFGITGMEERARRISGRFSVTSGLGAGTRVRLEVPCRARWRRQNRKSLEFSSCQELRRSER